MAQQFGDENGWMILPVVAVMNGFLYMHMGWGGVVLGFCIMGVVCGIIGSIAGNK